MKKWYFVAYQNRERRFVEWAVVRVAPAFLGDTMDQYIKFSGSVVGGQAFQLAELTGKPIFSKIVHQVHLPF